MPVDRDSRREIMKLKEKERDMMIKGEKDVKKMQKVAEKITQLKEQVRRLEEGRKEEDSEYKTDEEEVDINKAEAAGGLNRV